jgi:hypothetical protein
MILRAGQSADWMIQHGSDVHQGGDAPLMRAPLRGARIPMMELLVAHGADVNARWKGSFPVLFAPCEAVDPAAIAWLLQHGADPNVRGSQGETALDYLLESYVRSSELSRCVDVLTSAGGGTHYDMPGVLDIVGGQLDRLESQLQETRELIIDRFPNFASAQPAVAACFFAAQRCFTLQRSSVMLGQLGC